MVREICKDEVFLAQKAEAATEADLLVAEDLLETLMAHTDGYVGMAANMIGVNKRIIAFDNDGKKLDCSADEFLTVDEGLCVQILHLGPFDDEPTSAAQMDEYLPKNSYENDLSDTRLHHEIYLSTHENTD